MSDSDRRDRQIPYSEDAEQAVLSAVLMDGDALTVVAEVLDDVAFYSERHRRVYRAMIALGEKAIVIDPLTLAEQLSSRGELDIAGGKDFIGYLVDAVPTSANVRYHAEIVRDKAIKRHLITNCTQIIQDVYADGDARELLDVAESKIYSVAQTQRKDGFVRIKELLWPTMERIEQRQRGGKGITGVPSGFSDLDDMTSGFQPGDLIIVAARPSMGKTAFVLNAALHAAIEEQAFVAVFSLEMSKDALGERALASEARVDSQRIRKGMLRDDEFPMLARAAGILSGAQVWIDDTPGISLLEMRAKARRLKSETDGKLGLICVDYLQLMVGSGQDENRQQEVSAISRGLKALAKELNVPVIALSQLSRQPEQRVDKRPQLSDLRESGAIEQDADLILFLYRQEMYDGVVDKDGNSIEGKAELIIGKQRNGPTGFVNLHFYKQYTRFANWSPRQMDT